MRNVEMKTQELECLCLRCPDEDGAGDVESNKTAGH